MAGLLDAIPIVGDIAQGIGGMVGNYYSNKYNQKALNAQSRGLAQAQGIGESSYQNYMGQESPYAATYGGDVANWRNALGNYDQGQIGAFDPNVDIQSQLNPQVQYMQDQARRQIEQSAANAGGLLSGATGIAISNRSQDIASRAYDEAFNRGMQQKQFARQAMLQDFEAKRANAMQQMQNLQGIMGQSGAARENLQNAQFGLANLQAEGAQSQADIQAQKYASRGNYLSGQANTIGQGIGRIAGRIGQMGGTAPATQVAK